MLTQVAPNSTPKRKIENKKKKAFPAYVSELSQQQNTPQWSAVKEITDADIEAYEQEQQKKAKQKEKNKSIFGEDSDLDDDDLVFDIMNPPKPIILKVERPKSTSEEEDEGMGVASTSKSSFHENKIAANTVQAKKTDLEEIYKNMKKRRLSVALDRKDIDAYLSSDGSQDRNDDVKRSVKSSAKPKKKSLNDVKLTSGARSKAKNKGFEKSKENIENLDQPRQLRQRNKDQNKKATENETSNVKRRRSSSFNDETPNRKVMKQEKKEESAGSTRKTRSKANDEKAEMVIVVSNNSSQFITCYYIHFIHFCIFFFPNKQRTLRSRRISIAK